LTYIYIYGTNKIEWVTKKKGVKMKKVLFLIALGFAVSSLAFAEDITITTFYPAPFGVYRTLRVLNDNEEILMGNDANNPGIELRDLDGGGNTPYIDFTNDGASDFDFRVVLSADDDLDIRGGTTTFRNDNGTPATVRVGEVWYCASY